MNAEKNCNTELRIRLSGGSTLKRIIGITLFLGASAFAAPVTQTSALPISEKPAESKKSVPPADAASKGSRSDLPQPATISPQAFPGGAFVLIPASDPIFAKKPEEKQEWISNIAAILSATAWPFASLIILWRLLKSPQIEMFVSRVSKRITQLKVANLEITLTPGATATLKELQSLIAQVPETHQEWVNNSNLGRQFHLLISDIKTYLTTSVCDSGQPLSLEDFARFRFTLHVPDVLLAHSFRQLVDYVGCERGGSGRVFSTRLGIIGKAWRMETSEFIEHNQFTENELISEWGMTRLEARDTSKGKKVYLSILLKSKQGIPLAVIYADTLESKLFDPARQQAVVLDSLAVFARLETRILSASDTHGLIESLEDLENARIKLPQIDLYRR